MKHLISLCPLALLLLVPHVEAAPSKMTKKLTAASRVFTGNPTRDLGSLADGDTSIPSVASRAASASVLLGNTAVIELLWASVTPRRPKDEDRAVLVFTGAALVDAKRGLAKWGGEVSWSGGDTPPGFVSPEAIGCALFGCPGGVDGGGDRGMQLWVKGEATKRYYAECRVKLEGAKGKMAVTAEGFDVTFTLDHTGKSSARFGWVIDPTESGWFGFSLSTKTGWTAYGCSIDELE